MDLPYFRMFVLGAGFSRPAGLPLAEPLLQSVRDRVRLQFRSANWDGTLEQEIYEWQSLYPGHAVDLERVLAYSHRKHYLGLVGNDEYFDHGSRTIHAARRAIQEILIGPTSETSADLYREFARQLRPNDVVLTFNYDTVLEDALDDIGKPYTLTPEWWLENATSANSEARYVDVLKLHGSVDWYDRYYHDIARQWHADRGHAVPDRHALFGASPSVATESLAKGAVGEFGRQILPRVFRVPDHAARFPISTEWWELVPFILPLAYDKLLGCEPILDLWENLHRGTDAVSTIVLVGYSMPPYDGYAYEALGRLLVMYQGWSDVTPWGHRRVPIQIITLGASEEAVHSCYPFLDRTRTRIWHEGFSRDSLRWIDWGDGTP